MPRPEHSPLGASSAERWMACPGSVALIQAIGPGEESEYAAEGTLAHSLGAYCLEHGLGEAWEGLAEFPDATAEMTTAVQVYLDYMVTRRPARRFIEYDVQAPAFHPHMYGRLDAAVFDPEPGIALEIIDYKHGVGVLVDVEGNAQERYYGFSFLAGQKWPADLPRLPDDAKIKLTIIQPRGFHPDGPIRSEIITAGELRRWAYEELRPAMQRAGEHTFKLGAHCQFCPAKLVCPAMRHLATDAAIAANEQLDLVDTDDEWLGAWYGRMAQLDMFKKAIRDEVARRVLSGKDVPNAKLVYQVVDREWKPAATTVQTDADLPDIEMPGPIFAYFGEDAWEPRKLRSPASIEKLPGGKQFCAEYAAKPEAGLTVAPTSDRRKAQKALTDDEVFKDVEIPLTPSAE